MPLRQSHGFWPVRMAGGQKNALGQEMLWYAGFGFLPRRFVTVLSGNDWHPPSVGGNNQLEVSLSFLP